MTLLTAALLVPIVLSSEIILKTAASTFRVNRAISSGHKADAAKL
jgi:hypothetical protein